MADTGAVSLDEDFRLDGGGGADPADVSLAKAIAPRTVVAPSQPTCRLRMKVFAFFAASGRPPARNWTRRSASRAVGLDTAGRRKAPGRPAR